MADFVLVGGGAFARELFDWFQDTLIARGDRFIGVLVDSGGDTTNLPGNLPVVGSVSAESIKPEWTLVMGVAAPALKKTLRERLAGAAFGQLLHPTSIVSASASLGEGVILAPFTIVSANARVEDLVSVNVHSSVGHDVTLGAYSTLSSYVDLTGRVQVGPECLWGSGSRIIPGTRVGEQSTIGAGAVVTRHVKPHSTLYAPPARTL